MAADAVPRPRRRRLLQKLLLGTLTMVGMALVAELVVRAVDGYRLFASRLQPVAGRGAGEAGSPTDLVAAFLRQPALTRPDLDPEWFPTSPPHVPPHPLPPPMAETFAAGYHAVFLYQWNEALLRSVWIKGFGPSMGPELRKPDAYYVFAPVDGQPLPRYRFPTATTLPSGLTLNTFGYRGRDLPVDKAPNVIRIACVGASTTVDDHAVPHSYPELLEHFLSKWAERHRPELRFEVINAACEGYYSYETAVNVRHYVVPLAVDYVLYYEGANQLQAPQVMPHVRIEGAVPPAPQLPGLFDPTAAAKGERQWLYEHSAAARRLHTVLVRGQPIAEPSKPAQTLTFPDGLDESRIDLARAGEVLGLGQILSDLATIRTDVAAAGGKLVLSSFRWFVHDGLCVDPIRGEHVWRQLNETCWPVSYALMRRLADLQNRWFAAWAAANHVPFLDVAAALPADERLYTDAIHKSGLGSRCHAWAACALLLPQIERDLRSGTVPVPDPHADGTHPNVPPLRRLTRAELDAGR